MRWRHRLSSAWRDHYFCPCHISADFLKQHLTFFTAGHLTWKPNRNHFFSRRIVFCSVLHMNKNLRPKTKVCILQWIAITSNNLLILHSRHKITCFKLQSVCFVFNTVCRIDLFCVIYLLIFKLNILMSYTKISYIKNSIKKQVRWCSNV